MSDDRSPERPLQDHVIAVTAGAGGIGLVIARHLHALGARLAICDVDETALASVAAELDGTQTARVDVSDDAAVARFFDAIEDRRGRLDALINNAGIAGETGAVEEIDPGAFRHCLHVGLGGQFTCAHHAVPLLRAAGGGSIVCMSSVAGKHGYAYRTPYAATKFGVIGLAQSLAKELGPENIRVNAILPGFVEGPRMSAVIAERARQEGIDAAAMHERYVERVSLRRMVTAEDVAATVGFLLSPPGRNISGQSIAVDGNVETL